MAPEYLFFPYSKTDRNFIIYKIILKVYVNDFCINFCFTTSYPLYGDAHVLTNRITILKYLFFTLKHLKRYAIFLEGTVVTTIKKNFIFLKYFIAKI